MKLPKRGESADFTKHALREAFDRAMASRLAGVPADEREAVRRQCMDEIQCVLIDAPTKGDAMQSLRTRAQLAAAFFGRPPSTA